MQHQATFVPTGFGVNDVQIMAGTFDDFSFDDVVQVLGLSRQCLRLLIRKGEAAFSEVLLKAGQVLEARMPMSSDPDNVFRTLFGSAVQGSGLSFAVYHTEPSGPFPMPRCRLQEVYERVKARGQGAAALASSMLPRSGTNGSDSTVRLIDGPGPSQDSVAGLRASAQPGAAGQFAFAPSQATSDAWSNAVVARLQPLMREELSVVLAQVNAQAQTLNTLDGRLQSLPPLVAAELRLALAQHERSVAAAKTPRPDSGGFRGVLIAMGVGMIVLLLAVLALAFKALR